MAYATLIPRCDFPPVCKDADSYTSMLLKTYDPTNGAVSQGDLWTSDAYEAYRRFGVHYNAFDDYLNADSRNPTIVVRRLEQQEESMELLARKLEAYASKHGRMPAGEEYEKQTVLFSPGGSRGGIDGRAAFGNYNHEGDAFNMQRPMGYFVVQADDVRCGGWILTSVGPDGISDIAIRRDYVPWNAAAYKRLVQLTYDPTNGVLSRGDIWTSREREMYAREKTGQEGFDAFIERRGCSEVPSKSFQKSGVSARKSPVTDEK